MPELSSDEFENFGAPPQEAASQPVVQTEQPAVPATQPKVLSDDEFSSYKPQESIERTWSSVPGEALSNIPASAAQFASAIAQPIMHPIATAETLKNIGQGALQQAGILSGTEQIPYATAVGQFFADRYGGMENLKKTIATDPVGFAADVSAVLTGGEMAAARVPGIVAETAARTAGIAARATDPINAAANAVKAGASVFAPGSADARTLAVAGVQMTPGQMIGGPFKSIEDAVTSIPILGSFVSGARGRSIDSFNKSVANQALEPIGETLSRKTPAGHATVDEVATKLGNAYDNLVPNLKWIPDKDYFADLKTIEQKDLPILPPQQVEQYRSIINSRMGRQAPMSGEQFKTIESELSGIGRNYGASADPAQRDLGKAINNTVMAMRENLERSNPAHAEELANINSGWAMYSRIRNAASRRVTSEGVFTPSDLLAAIKSGDRSVGKGSFARGDALMQTFAETGQRVLPSKIPTSGTTERGMTVAGLLGGSTLLHSPAILAGGTAGILPYTGPGMRTINALYRARPTQYIPPGIGQTSFQLGRIGEQQPQSRGGKISAAMSIAKRMGKRKS